MPNNPPRPLAKNVHAIAHQRTDGADPRVLSALAAELADLVAARVLDALSGLEPGPKPDRGLLEAHQVADRLGVTREWVYAHADELGAIRLGNGSRPRLRFPPDLATRRESSRRARDQKTTRPQPADSNKPSGLLPVYDD
jgi:hypothetical protein